jgi:hypothetical protein
MEYDGAILVKSERTSTMRDELSTQPPTDMELEIQAQKHEQKVQLELHSQYKRLRDQAKGIFAAVQGRRGANTEEYWIAAFDAAKSDYQTGKFLVERLGADRQLDLPLVATLTQLRHQILEGIEAPSIADHMLADSAVLAYRNMLRVQGWVGSTSFVIERELFGQEPLQTSHGHREAIEIEKRVKHLEETLIPLLDRAQRMMVRALDRLAIRHSGTTNHTIAIGLAGQVNVQTGR